MPWERRRREKVGELVGEWCNDGGGGAEGLHMLHEFKRGGGVKTGGGFVHEEERASSQPQDLASLAVLLIGQERGLIPPE